MMGDSREEDHQDACTHSDESYKKEETPPVKIVSDEKAHLHGTASDGKEHLHETAFDGKEYLHEAASDGKEYLHEAASNGKEHLHEAGEGLHHMKDGVSHMKEGIHHAREEIQQDLQYVKIHTREGITGSLTSMERSIRNFLDWAVFGILVGLIAGFVAAVFGLLLTALTAYRRNHVQLILGLPLAGLAIVFLYNHVGERGDKGTNLVLRSVREGEKVPWYVAVRIFIATAITHLFGGSAGREGAALQLGSSISSTLAKLLHREGKDTTITVMCGMSAAFSALFGTPLAASIFAMEVVNVGEMYYSALVPCSFAALVGSMVADVMGAEGEIFQILALPKMTPVVCLKILILAAGCALVSVIFCLFLHAFHHFFHKSFWNPYAAVLTSGILVVFFTIAVQSSDYMGTGMHIIEKAMEGEVRPEAFLLKILFTALTLGAGYKGGEIVPSFFIGATFGCLAGQILGISPSLCAAVGMVSVFCGVTNCPISSLLIAAELFGFDGIYYFLIGVVVSYMLSGYYSLYSSQKIIFGKYRSRILEKFD